MSPHFSNRPFNALWSLSKNNAKPPTPKSLWGVYQAWHRVYYWLACVKSVFLVGGFAASDYLYQKLKAAFTSQGIDVSRPDSHVYVSPLILWSGINDSSATKPSLTALYPSTLIILCPSESRSLLTGQKPMKISMPLILNMRVESTRRSWVTTAASKSLVYLV